MDILENAKIIRGRYTIVKHLGGGGFGQTYVVEDRDLPNNQKRVLKRLKPQKNDDYTLEVAGPLFNKEAETLNNLKHDQIPRLLAYFEEDKEFYLVQELISGHDLSNEIQAGKPWTEDQVITLLKNVLPVLEYIHSQNVIHRDLKPANLMRRKEDQKIVLIDFGAVKQVSNQVLNAEGEAQSTKAIGTNHYMPSEQQGGHPVFNSDIYTLGVIAIQALTGSFPLPIDSQTNEILWRDRAQVSDGLADILDKMVCYYFLQRYQSATEVLDALDSLTNPVPDIEPPPPPPPPKRFLKPLLIGLVFCSVVGVIALPKLIQKLVDSQLNLNPKTSSGISTNFLTYENADYGLKIKYPENWKRQDIQSLLTGELIKLIVSQANATDISQENVIISVEDLSKKQLSLEEYTKSAISEIQKNTKDAKILNSNSSTLANRPAHMVVFTGKDDSGMALKTMQVWTLKNNKAYNVTYTGEENKYEQYLKAVEEMIGSFEIMELKSKG